MSSLAEAVVDFIHSVINSLEQAFRDLTHPKILEQVLPASNLRRHALMGTYPEIWDSLAIACHMRFPFKRTRLLARLFLGTIRSPSRVTLFLTLPPHRPPSQDRCTCLGLFAKQKKPKPIMHFSN